MFDAILKLFGKEEVKPKKMPIKRKAKPKKRALNKGQKRVYDRLKKHGETSVFDYGTGFALRSRISDLKDKGFNIIAVPYDPIDGKNRLVRYVLLAK